MIENDPNIFSLMIHYFFADSEQLKRKVALDFDTYRLRPVHNYIHSVLVQDLIPKNSQSNSLSILDCNKLIL
jgi:hypothetical protein